MKAKALSTWRFAVEVYEEWTEDNCFRLAAALSYYTIFSLAPIVLIVITTAGLFFGREAVTGEVYHQIHDLIGDEGAKAIQDLVENAYFEDKKGLAAWISVITLIFSATVTFSVLQDSLNTIWKVKVKPERGFIKFLVPRVLSFAMVVAIGFLLMVSLIINTLLVAVEGFIAIFFEKAGVYILFIVQNLISLAVITFMFAAMYKFLPDVIVRWRNVWKASLLTAVLFTIGKSLIGYYLGQSNLATTYGAAASIIIILLWVNYSSWIFFIGAEYIYVVARRRGERITPSRYAVRVRWHADEEE